MPDPHETLSIFAEIAIALAGFSGIVIAFGQRSMESLSPLEMRRLSNLFTLSGMLLCCSLLGASLLHLNIAEPSLFWRWASAAVFLVGTPWLIRDVVKVTRLEQAERAQVNLALLTFFNTLAVCMLVLQLINTVRIKEPWPFFLALTLITAGAFQQFILLVRMRIQQRSSQLSSELPGSEA
ncbi:MAG: hypothetical protein ACR2PZ_19620 [Pseudomonadales bacterium]